MPGGLELFVVLAIVFLLFGGKKIPELMKGLGSGIKNFKQAMKEDEELPSQQPQVEAKKETARVVKTSETSQPTNNEVKS
jgi:sec-independent protein translocase protein TatA